MPSFLKPLQLSLLPIVILIVGSISFAQDAISYRLLKHPGYVVFEDGVTPRARVRANYYSTDTGDTWEKSPGQISIEYGLPAWKAEYDTLFMKMPNGKRWRLGSNYWTNLSSTLPFEVAGKKIKAGYYYLVLEKTSKELWSLIVLRPEDVTMRQMDPYHVNLRDSGPGVASIPLEYQREEQKEDKLQITLKLKDENPKQMAIHIRFGSHHFSTPLLAVHF
ncbi:MAG TPA: DUF2911 domain-containing protein [Terriglobia bacterium]|nr:DUF2911 domain-containing protein [Terriglobia bacterium]